MAVPKFSKSGHSDIILEGFLAFPLRSPREKVQVTDRTAAGTLQVEDLGAEIKSFPLNLELLDAATHSALVDWWDNVADGAVNPFTYTDPDGNDWTVRMLTRPLDLPRIAPGLWSGQLLLEVDA